MVVWNVKLIHKNKMKEGDRMYIVIVTLKDGKRYIKHVDTYDEAVYLCLLIKKI